MRYGIKWPVYAKQWDSMQIKPDRKVEIQHLAQIALDNKARYQKIEHVTGVPWYLVAMLHRRESDADFSTYLGNGEPLNRRTRLVPPGRGPFSSFEDGAIDALRLDKLTDVIDWRLEKLLYYCEIFNGAGYDQRGKPSPYVWGGTSIQQAGKYVSDGRWSSSSWDKQPGTAALLRAIMDLDPSVNPKRED